MFWTRKKPENVKETYEKRLLAVESKVLQLDTQVLALVLDQKVLRDKVLRKIQFKKPTEDEEEKDPKQQKDVIVAI